MDDGYMLILLIVLEGKFLICWGMVDNLIVFIDGWLKFLVGVDCKVLLMDFYDVDIINIIVFGFDMVVCWGVMEG